MTYIPDDKPLTAGDLRAIIADRMSVRKNGHTWRQYLEKWVTPQNILVAALALFTVGGRVQQAQTDIAKALDSNIRLVAEIATLSKAVDTQQGAIDAQQKVIEAQREMFATKESLEALGASFQEQMRITRRDLRDQIQPIATQLRNIQASVKDQR